MLSSMHNHLIGEFKKYNIAQNIWLALKVDFRGNFYHELHGLIMRFDSYKRRFEHTIKQHLREMSSKIYEFEVARNNLIDKQQVQVMICSLTNSWETISQNLTHNENIKIFDNVSRHLILEAKHLETTKPKPASYVVESGSRKRFRPKCKNTKIDLATRCVQKESRPSIRNEISKHEKGKSKLDCFNFGKKMPLHLCLH